MATKSITIDTEAYDRLKAAKQANESFSGVIKRVVPKKIDFEAWLKSMDANPVGDEFVRAIEERVARRRPSLKPRKR